MNCSSICSDISEPRLQHPTLGSVGSYTPSPPLLSTTYFGPIEWYGLLAEHDEVWLEACESYQKQTWRNRCRIIGPNGVQTLSVPVSGGRSVIADTHVSSHGNWPHQHSQALQTAYGDSPFFIYYADDLLPLLEQPADSLLSFNLRLTQTLCHLLDIRTTIHLTTHYSPTPPSLTDYRDALHPKRQPPANIALTAPYYQVFAARHGFTPHLSILDLLFNMGPESILYLRHIAP